MSKFKSTYKEISTPRNEVYCKLQNTESFKSLLNNIPDDIKSQMGEITMEGNTITINAKPVGELSFHMEKGEENKRLHLVSEKSPLPLSIDIILEDCATEGTTMEYVEVSLGLNPILTTMVSKPLQEACEKFADVIAKIPYDRI